MKILPIAALALFLTAGCVQVGPKDEPLHIILDVNIRVQVDEAVQQLWNSVEKAAPKTP